MPFDPVASDSMLRGVKAGSVLEYPENTVDGTFVVIPSCDLPYVVKVISPLVRPL